MNKDLVDSEAITNLFWFYKKLLTVKQNNYFRLYFIEDWSLSEIGGHYHVTAAAVHDALLRIKKILMKYETCLNLQFKQCKREEIYAIYAETGKLDMDALRKIDDYE